MMIQQTNEGLLRALDIITNLYLNPEAGTRLSAIAQITEHAARRIRELEKALADAKVEK